MSIVILVVQLAVPILLLVMIMQIARLEKSSPLIIAGGTVQARVSEPAHRVYEEPALAPQDAAGGLRGDVVAKAQIFAGIQMLDAKRKGLSLREGHPDGCIKMAAAYLMGAARGISHALHADERCAQDVSAFLITHNLGSVGRHTEQLLRQLGRDESMLVGYRCGLEAAESWMARKYVPDTLSLYALMSEEAFV